MDRAPPVRLTTAPTLSDALGAGRGDVVALVGGGGKTTAMYALLRELREKGIDAAAATTTKIAVPSTDEAQLILGDEWPELRRRVVSARQAAIVLGRRLVSEEKVEGIPEDWCGRLIADGIVEALIVEADGAARRPVKAPAAWEPVVPTETTIFVAVVGLSCVGSRIAAEGVFRPERVAAVTGLPLGTLLDPSAVARLLVSQEGLYKGCPEQAEAYVLLNQADGPKDLDAARCVAERVLGCESHYRAVVAARLQSRNPIRAVWER